MSFTRRLHSLKHLGLGVLALLLFGMSSLYAQGASSIAQSFETEDVGVVPGALVALKPGSANTVELGTSENVDRILGVVGESSLIELSDGRGTVKVATTGEAALLVSNINGDIKTGDKITASPIAGVGMKALTSTLIIGTAQANLGSVSTEARTITDRQGRRQEVRIGTVPVQVDKVFYEADDNQSSYVPPVLQDFANNLAGHPVSSVRIVLSGFLVVFVFVTVVVLMYSSIRSSIISIGRNPLSESAVHKGLLQVGLTVFGVMGFTVIVVYLVLTT